jgi:16S rRNA processing protein RimM
VKKDEHLLIGKIIGVQGIKGGLKVFSHAESPRVFEAGKYIRLRGPSAEVEGVIRSASPYKKGIVLSLEGVDDRNQAETLIGFEIYIPREDLPELEEGTYYWADLIGLSVYTTGEEYLGRIASIIPTGSNDVYVVRDGGQESLIPALASVVIAVDLEKGTMRVNLPEGL